MDRGAGEKARPVQEGIEEGHRTREKSSGGEAGRTGRLAMGCGKHETLRTYESGMVLCVGGSCESQARVLELEEEGGAALHPEVEDGPAG